MTGSDKEARAKVLVALDGSPAAAAALPIARVVAAQFGAGIEILHIAPYGRVDPDLGEQLHQSLSAEETVRILSPAGSTADGILEAAAAPEVALLVLATHGRAVEPGRHLGHVAEAVAAATARPILLVRPEAAAAQAPRALRRLLLPMNGSPTTAVTLRPVTELAAALDASIDLLHVLDPSQSAPGEQGSLSAPRYMDQPQHEWPQFAQEIVDRLCTGLARCPAAVPVRVSLAQGECGAEIARFAAEHETNAIVLVRQSHLEPGHGQVLHAVFDRTPCPVLLVGVPVSAPMHRPGRRRPPGAIRELATGGP
jgi:nucleotide-binding universal stress UspA family protein